MLEHTTRHSRKLSIDYGIRHIPAERALAAAAEESSHVDVDPLDSAALAGDGCVQLQRQRVGKRHPRLQPQLSVSDFAA